MQSDEKDSLELLCYFRHRWLGFRLPEIEALGPSQLRWKPPHGLEAHSPFWYIHLPNLEAAKSIADRSVLLKVFVQLWGEGSNFEELKSSIESCSNDIKSSYYSEDVSFRICVDAWGIKISQKEKVEYIEKLNFLPLKGPIRLKNPDETFWLIIANPSQETGFPGVPFRLYFGRQIAISDTSRSDRFALSRREYLGPTSMDAEMAFIMCNHAKVKRGDLVIDPFVGTGSILVAAAHFGCLTVGCDIDAKILKQSKTNKHGRICNIWSNFNSYELQQPIGLFVCDIQNSPFTVHSREIFDAVICDPPYGVRAGSKKQNPKEKKTHCTVGEMCRDLLNFAAKCLKIGGRLVFFCPSLPGQSFEKDLVQHPMMKIIFCCEQFLSMKYSRCLITFQKTTPYREKSVLDFYEKMGPPILSVDRLHEIVFDEVKVFKGKEPIPKFRCKQL